jgi:hypothetical protein
MKGLYPLHSTPHSTMSSASIDSSIVSLSQGRQLLIANPDLTAEAHLISSASGMERGEVFYGPTDWLGSYDPMTCYHYTPDSSSWTG